MSNIQIYATLFKNGGSFISHTRINVGGGVCDSRTSKRFALQTLNIDFRGSHLSLQLTRRHGQAEGWLLAEGPGHQQPFVPHLLQTQHHLMEPDSTLTHMERRGA